MIYTHKGKKVSIQIDTNTPIDKQSIQCFIKGILYEMNISIETCIDIPCLFQHITKLRIDCVNKQKEIIERFMKGEI